MFTSDQAGSTTTFAKMKGYHYPSRYPENETHRSHSIPCKHTLVLTLQWAVTYSAAFCWWFVLHLFQSLLFLMAGNSSHAHTQPQLLHCRCTFQGLWMWGPPERTPPFAVPFTQPNYSADLPDCLCVCC